MIWCHLFHRITMGPFTDAEGSYYLCELGHRRTAPHNWKARALKPLKRQPRVVSKRELERIVRR